MLKAFAIGNLGQDAKIKDVNGRTAIQFSIAVNEAYTNKENVKVEKTTWLNCTMWRDSDKSTKVAEYLKKGTQVHIEFKPSVDVYQGEGGKWAASINCNVTALTLLGAKKEEGTNSQAPEYSTAPNNNDDLPY